MATGKYRSDNLISMFGKAAIFRNEMLAAGFSDNGGAIHSAERILNILGQRLKYPGLSHINGLRHYELAVFSTKAQIAHKKGERVLIEHVSPIRALTRKAIDKVVDGSTDEQLAAFVKAHYRIVLLTPEEMARLSKQNRSKISRKRLELAGIRLQPRKR